MSWAWVVALGTVAAAIGAAAGRLSAQHTIRQLRTHNIHLTELAFHDRLTGVLNRAGLEDAFTAADHENRLLMVVDIDAFKSVNDRHGHPAGDEALTALAHRLNELASHLGGTVGRLGGDEFAIVAPAVSRTAAEIIGADATAVLPIGKLPTGLLTVSASAGIAFAPAGQPWKCALAAADIALYQAKRRGGMVIYEAGMAYPYAPGPRRRARDSPAGH